MIADPLSALIHEGRQHRTLVLTAREKDGTIETREIEPYSFRRGPSETRLIYYCLLKQGTRSTLIHNILSVEATGRSFTPRWAVEL